jgi:hypothetical protein
MGSGIKGVHYLAASKRAITSLTIFFTLGTASRSSRKNSYGMFLHHTKEMNGYSLSLLSYLEKVLLVVELAVRKTLQASVQQRILQAWPLEHRAGVGQRYQP